MKTNLVRQCSLVVAAGLIFSLGCARPSAQPEQPRTVAAPGAPPAGVDAPAIVATNVFSLDDTNGIAASDTNAPAILERIPPVAQPDAVPLSPGLAEVARLAQAGVGEEVLVAYIEKYEGGFDIGADQILYLNDLGVSSAVITALLKKDGKSEDVAATLTNAAPTLVQTQIVSNVPQNQALPVYAAPQPEEQPAPAAPEVTTQVAPPPSSPEVSYFYDTLAPYGSWMYVSGYGWCWQPTVAVSVPTWRPYMDRGRWYWSDAGWYWSSDYSWGWAPFHYGRWYHHARSGWLWAPGTVWGPSWVSWRYYDGYCGWAPLPPEARFVTGIGLTFHSRRVSVGFDFGLSPFHYSFVHLNNFCDYSPYRYAVPHTRVRNFYRNTTVINNYIVGNNNTIVNRGIGRDTVARSSQTRVREVALRDRPVQDVSRIRGDQIERQGNRLVAYRPQLPKDPPRIRTAQFASRAGAGSGSGASQPDATVARPGAARQPRAGTVNRSEGPGQTVRPTTGGRVPSSVSAPSRREREAVAQPRPPAAERPAPPSERTPRTAPREGRRSSAEAGERSPATPSTTLNNNEVARQARQNAAASQQADYQRQQQLRTGPLFGSTVAGATPQAESRPRRQSQSVRAGQNAVRAEAQPGGTTSAPLPVQPRPQPQPQNNPAAARAEETRVARPVTPAAPRPSQTFPQRQSQPQNNPAAARPAVPVYPRQQVPAARVEPRNYGNAPSSPGRTMSPRHAEQVPSYRAPVRQAPPQRQYSAPAPRQEMRAAPSGGGGRGVREAAPSRGERAR